MPGFNSTHKLRSDILIFSNEYKGVTVLSVWKERSVYLVGLFFLISMIDIAREYSAGETISHLSFEVFVCITACLWSLFLWREWLMTRSELNKEKADRLELNTEYQRWKETNLSVLSKIRESISEQLSKWDFTPAEKEVAFLLLKGLPFKEIAIHRGTTEKTIRHHAQKIYLKSGLQGRTEFFAYFFEDIFQNH